MSKIEITYTPTTGSVERKNNKFMMAQVLIQIWRDVQDCKDEETKDKIIKQLLLVL